MRESAVSISRSFGGQLRDPQGWGGWLAGAVMRFANEECNRLAVETLRVEPGDTVLEIGCGPGHALALLAARAPHALIHGVDQSDLMISQASARNRKAIREGRVRLHRGDFALLPMSDQSVDAILAVNVAYFWQRADVTLGELRRVMRPGAQLVIYVTDRMSMQNWRFASSKTHVHWDASTLRAALRRAGFGAGEIEALSVRLRGGIRGLLAVAWMG